MSTIITSVLAASVLAAGIGLAVLPTAGEPSATAMGMKDQARYSAQLEQSFELAGAVNVDRHTLQTITAAARKSDRLGAGAGCARQSWPNVALGCLVGNSGNAVRTVTVEYRVGESTSVLVRHPAPQIASR